MNGDVNCFFFLDYVNKKFLNCNGQSIASLFVKQVQILVYPIWLKEELIILSVSVLFSVYIFLESVSREREVDHLVLLLNLFKVFQTHKLLHVQSPQWKQVTTYANSGARTSACVCHFLINFRILVRIFMAEFEHVLPADKHKKSAL